MLIKLLERSVLPLCAVFLENEISINTVNPSTRLQNKNLIHAVIIYIGKAEWLLVIKYYVFRLGQILKHNLLRGIIALQAETFFSESIDIHTE